MGDAIEKLQKTSKGVPNFSTQIRGRETKRSERVTTSGRTGSSSINRSGSRSRNVNRGVTPTSQRQNSSKTKMRLKHFPSEKAKMDFRRDKYGSQRNESVRRIRFDDDDYTNENSSRSAHFVTVKKFVSNLRRDSTSKDLCKHLEAKGLSVKSIKKLKSRYTSHHSSYYIELIDIDVDKLFEKNVWRGLQIEDYDIMIKQFRGYPRDSDVLESWPSC